MLKQDLIFNRADRISALARLALAAPTLAAALFDPPQPQELAPYAIGVLQFYIVLAALVAAVVWHRPLSARPIGQYVHIVDLAVFALLVYLTRGITSPFFPLYLFTILSGTLRWDWRGAVGTSLCIVALYLPAALVMNGQFDTNADLLLRFVVRMGQIVVLGAMLAYIGLQRERYWRELLRLSQPVEAHGSSVRLAINDCLVHARSFFDAPSAIFIWQWRDEPGWQIVREGAGPPLPPLPGPGWAGPVLAGLESCTFEYQANATHARSYDGTGNLRNFDRPLLDPAMAAAWGVEEAIVTAINCDTLDGWMLIPKAVTEDDLYLARAVSVQLGAALGNAAAAETLRDAAASEERVRVAHDLHDGILQFLTGLALQLRLMEREVATSPDQAKSRIQALGPALRQEQQDLRAMLERIRPRQTALPEQGRPMADWIPMLADQWDVSIDADIGAEPPGAIAEEIRLITREAIANAVRHGAARRISIRAEATPDNYRLAISDNGRGLAQTGQFDAETLRERGIGPRSILHRLDRLGGQLQLSTSPAGTLLDLRFAAPAKVLP
jgi:signal transduction histidine kinase